MSTNPIVLCYDATPEAQAAIERAAQLFRGAPVVVVHAVHPQSATSTPIGTSSLAAPGGANPEAVRGGSAARHARQSMEHAERIAHEGAERARSAGFEDAKPHVAIAEHHIWEAVVEAADDVDAAAVVVGSRGRGALKGALLGSTSTGLVHHCNRPVLVVRGAGGGE